MTRLGRLTHSRTIFVSFLIAVLLSGCTITIDLPIGTPTPRGGRAPTTPASDSVDVTNTPRSARATRTPRSKSTSTKPTKTPKSSKTPATKPTRTPRAGQPAALPSGIGATNVEMIVLPDDGVDGLADMIRSARKRVYLKIYLLTEEKIFAALEDRHAAGLDVKVLIEPSPLGGASSARAAQTRLRDAGIDVKTANPAFRLTHEKSFVIDDMVIILTSNMTRGSFTRNREFGVITRDPTDVKEVVKCFDADWNREAFVPQAPNLVWSPDNSRTKIDALIVGAQRTLDVYAASTLDDEQLGLLAAARKRGVVVRVITTDRSSGDSEDAAAGDLDRLQRARVKVRYMQSPLVHAKVFLADYGEPNALAFVGSVNITTQSLDFNRELGILLADQNAHARIHDTFEIDWQRSVDR